MDFSYSEQDEALKQEVRDFVEGQLAFSIRITHQFRLFL